MQASRIVRTTGVLLLTIGAAAAIGALIVRDQFSRHRHNLFSSRALQRFAALGYIAGLAASVEAVQLLRDFVAWETRGILRRRAQQILGRMEQQLGSSTRPTAEFAG